MLTGIINNNNHNGIQVNENRLRSLQYFFMYYNDSKKKMKKKREEKRNDDKRSIITRRMKCEIRMKNNDECASLASVTFTACICILIISFYI